MSKALAVAAYRDKLRALATHVDVQAVLPDRWRPPVEAAAPDDSAIRGHPVYFPGRNHLHLYRRPNRLFQESRPHLVHIDEEPYSAVTFQLLRSCRRRGIPAVFFAWQNLAKRLPPPFSAFRSYVLRHAAGAIAGTERAAEVLRRAGYGKALAVIPQVGVDERRFAPDPDARRRVRAELRLDDEHAVLVGFAGRFVAEKGLSDLLHALRQVPGTHALLIGEGSERAHLTRLASRLDMGARLRIVPRVSSLDVADWLNALDIAVLPSRTTRTWAEQFGRFLVEAMACGVAVVGTDTGEIPRVVGDAGMIVPEGDVAALAAAIRRFADAPDLRARFAGRGRTRVLRHYTQARVAAATAAFYHEVTARARGA